MFGYDVGIVLTSAQKDRWNGIVPGLLVYDSPAMYEIAVRRIINRQLALQSIDHMCRTVIIFDGVSLSHLSGDKLGLAPSDLPVIFRALKIDIKYDGPEKYSHKLFKNTWNWLSTSVAPDDKFAFKSLRTKLII